MGIEELANHIFAYDIDRPSLAVAEALARKLWDLGYRRIGVNEPSTEELTPYEDMPIRQAMSELAKLVGRYYADVHDVDGYIASVRGSRSDSR